MTKGDLFRIPGHIGLVYKFDHYMPNGDIVAYGGQRNPNGRRQWRSFATTIEVIPVKNRGSKRATI